MKAQETTYVIIIEPNVVLKAIETIEVATDVRANMETREISRAAGEQSRRAAQIQECLKNSRKARPDLTA